MNNLIPELLNRINQLEKRVSQLEAQEQGTATDRASSVSATDFTPTSSRTLRFQALNTLSQLLPEGYRFVGRGNKNTKGLHLLSHDGTKVPVYFTASRNYAIPPEVDAFQTILKQEILDGKYDTYILAIEDADGSFVFFVLPSSDMVRSVVYDPSSLDVYTFRITKAPDGRFINVANGKATQDLTPYKYTGTQLGN